LYFTGKAKLMIRKKFQTPERTTANNRNSTVRTKESVDLSETGCDFGEKMKKGVLELFEEALWT
jgi:hypothetical protein